jgi:hypothetical protein
MGKVQNALDDVNRWAKGFIFGPLAALVGAVGLAFYHRSKERKEE